MSIIVFLLILSILVLVHEFGHFLVAKKNGIQVEEFGFGFPPRIIGIKKCGTIYSINLFPIGGFVKLYGEEYGELNHEISDSKKKRSFAYHHPLQKTMVLIAGVVGNFLLGWLLISILFTVGIPAPTNSVIIENVQKNSPAAKAGIKEKDVVIKIDQHKLISADEFIILTKKKAGKEIVLEIERNKKKFTFKITPRPKPPLNQGPLGVVITSYVEKKYPWYKAPLFGLMEAMNITKTIIKELLKTIFQLLSFKKPAADITGPIGIAQYTGQAIKFGRNAVLELIALLSLNLAVVNILPFPALDGGRLVFVFYEWITKKKINQTIEKNLNMIGFLILISLAILISINDIIRIYK